MKQVKVFVDGGSRGNPGLSACAFSVIVDDKIIFEKAVFIGVATNNQAEYLGVIHALDWLMDNQDFQSITVILDSQLVAKQMEGSYKIKNRELLNLYNVAKNIESKINNSIKYTSVSRSLNQRPDTLLNNLLDRLSN